MAIARRRFCLLTSFLYTSRSKYTHAHATVEIWPQQAKRIGLTPCPHNTSKLTSQLRSYHTWRARFFSDRILLRAARQ